MIRLPLGIVVLALFISACSTQTVNTKNSQESTQKKQQDKAGAIASTQPVDASEVNEHSTDSLINQDNTNKAESKESDEVRQHRTQLLQDIRNDLANTVTEDINNLKHRIKTISGTFDTHALTQLTSDLNEAEMKSEIEALHDLKIKVQRETMQLEQRIEQRKATPKKADLLQIYLSEALITSTGKTYKTLPLVGEWTRGESRTIHVKDRELFNSQFFENITISFSEEYALIVNGQEILTVDLSTTKNGAPFKVKSIDNTTDISGKIDYKIK